MDPLTSQLLLAAPTLADPNFARSVVLIAAHDEAGAMGVILNRPTDTAVIDAAPMLDDLVGPGDPVFAGGPVQPSGVVVLAEFEDPREAAVLALENIGFLAAGGEEPEPPSGVVRARVFAGHAGWGPGQLESELEREDWIVEPALPEDVFHPDPEELWGSVLRRKGGSYALLARMPLDPRVN